MISTQPFSVLASYKKNHTMTKTKHLITIIIVLSVLSSCFYGRNDDDDIIDAEPQSQYEPVILEREAFNTSVALLEPQNQEEMGKIYVKDNFLFISEPYKGFHIFDNTNPENPIKLKFLKVLGSTDISIKNEVLYINNAVDLIAITFNNTFTEATVSKRIEDIFPELISPDGYHANTGHNDVVVDWKLKN